MDQQRPLLYFTLLFLGYLIWTTWLQDHAPKPTIPETTVNGIVSQNSPASNKQLDIPSA